MREIVSQRLPWWEHSYLSLYTEWPKRKEIASFVFDMNLPLKKNRRLFVEFCKQNQTNGKDQRGAGAPLRKASYRLKILGHARLWGLLQKLTEGWERWGVDDEYRFKIYEKFLGSESLRSYSSLAKLKHAIRNSNLITGSLLCTIN